MSIPPPIGPYSPIRRVGEFLYCSGQIGKRNDVLPEAFDAQLTNVLENLKDVFQSEGADLDKIFKTTIFLTDISNYSGLNAIYGEYFSKNPPARSAVAVAALPAGALVEIEAIAYVG